MRPFAQISRKFPPPLLSIAASALSLILVVTCSAWTVSAQALGDVQLQEQIAKYSAIAQKADPPAMTPVHAGRIWTYLGTLYEDAGQLVPSEMAYLHALRLLEIVPVSPVDQARAMDDLGTLYMMRGDTRQAERAELHALEIRKTQSLRDDLPRSWYHLATLSLREHRPQQAKDYAQQAVDALEAQSPANPDDQINAEFVLGMAECRMDRYPEAIAIMRKAMGIVQTEYKPDEFPSGFGSFLLGYAYWKSGDTRDADSLLKEGELTVERQLGNAHPVTVTIQLQYERYLRNTHQQEAAREVNQRLKQSQTAPGFSQGSGTLAVASLF